RAGDLSTSVRSHLDRVAEEEKGGGKSWTRGGLGLRSARTFPARAGPLERDSSMSSALDAPRPVSSRRVRAYGDARGFVRSGSLFWASRADIPGKYLRGGGSVRQRRAGLSSPDREGVAGL